MTANVNKSERTDLSKAAIALDALAAAGAKNAWIEFEDGLVVEIGTPKR
jgi:hypothetical protein